MKKRLNVCFNNNVKRIEMAEEERIAEGVQNSEKDELIPNRPKSSARSYWSFWLVFTAAVVVLGSSFQFGYATSSINGPEQVNSK